MDYYRSLDAASLDPDVPTVFELLAIQQLQDLIQPSIRFLVMHYAERHPAYLLKIANRFEEIYAVTFGLVEYYHLREWNSSFTEKFYGIKRSRNLAVPAIRSNQSVPRLIAKQRRLTKAQRILSLAALIVVPYLREKAEIKYERLRGRYAFQDIAESRPSPDSPWNTRLAWEYDAAFLKWWPRLLFGARTMSLAFTVAYVYQGGGPSSWTDFVLGTRYTRIGSVDNEQLEKKGPVVFAWLSALGYTLPTALFVLKFLEWWNASDFAQKLASQGPILDPPTTSETLQGCGVCGRIDVETPTALESGAIFCYKCIYNVLSDNPPPPFQPVCPATGRKLLLTTWNETDNMWKVGGLRRIMV